MLRQLQSIVRLLARLLRSSRTMVFKITKEHDDSGVLMHIDGDLNHEGLNELALVYKNIKEPLTIDLSGLRTTDNSIVKTLRQMAREGVKLEGASPYLLLQLSDQDEAGLISYSLKL